MVTIAVRFANRKYTMPTPEHPQPSPGALALIAAFIAAAGVIIGSFFSSLSSTVGSWLTRKTTLETKKIDGKEAYYQNLQEDVNALRVEVRAYHVETDTLRAAVYAEQLKAIEHESQIAHNKLEIEQLRAQITTLHDNEVKTKSDYEARIAILMADIAEKQAEIDRLTQYIADMEVIGVGEMAPPKRLASPRTESGE